MIFGMDCTISGWDCTKFEVDCTKFEVDCTIYGMECTISPKVPSLHQRLPHPEGAFSIFHLKTYTLLYPDKFGTQPL
ncbi:hypothetical protein SAMN05877753_101644 [Bacillus oleivorans]|uniref:Uncharacterized protein n=1 Tax=Bacillus oleivorans TaxID=1448271 RepID=A0A285CIZ9_9BACI|nr:hypothetical protein SAMN05877753_101644 [Bacillus oleivorans]